LLEFSINNYKEIEQLYLHDSELKRIIVDYADKKVRVNLLTVQTNQIPQKQVEFIFQGVTDVHIPINEPWGSGFYVSTISVERENALIRTRLELNSGDEITCISELIKTDIPY
jgi:hypothetical protein